MKHVITLLLALLFVSGCANTKTLQIREATSDGKLTSTYSKGPNGEMEAYEWDSKEEFDDCMSNIDRRQLNGMTADAYCSQKTRSDRRKRSDAMTGNGMGAFALNGGAMPGGWVGSPGYSAPPIQNGGPYATGAHPGNAQFATATPVYANGNRGTSADQALVEQTVVNARKNTELERRLSVIERGSRSRPAAKTRPPEIPADTDSSDPTDVR